MGSRLEAKKQRHARTGHATQHTQTLNSSLEEHAAVTIAILTFFGCAGRRAHRPGRVAQVGLVHPSLEKFAILLGRVCHVAICCRYGGAT